MHRRTFLAATVAAPLIGRLSLLTKPAQAVEPALTFAWRRFEIITRVALQNSPGPSATLAAIGTDCCWLPGGNRCDLAR
jgi:hypothetical protein